ncbi:MAG: exostosin family protein, partial [Leifsonia sp.]
MRVHMPRVGGEAYRDAPAADFEKLATIDTFGRHVPVDDPREADCILFTQCHVIDWRLRAIRRHPVLKAYRDRCLVYDIRDTPWLSLPGVYVSVPAGEFSPRSQRAWAYPYFADPAVRGSSVEPDLLFSFVGSRTARCRDVLFELRHPDAVVEEPRDFDFWSPSVPQRTRFNDVLVRSRFVLCPRGRGTSSFRLYEVLSAGRVPVIISDDWVPPHGPEWEKFSIRWPEGRTDGLVEHLESHGDRWASMSAEAASAYASHFAPE